MKTENKKKFEKLFKDFFPDLQCKHFEINNFSAALIKNNFLTYKKHFLNRIQKITKYCSNNNKCIKKLKELICLLGDNKNHEGAYSEIVAFHNLIQCFSCYEANYESIKCEIDEISDNTLGKFFNKKKTNYDFQIGDVYIDVKAFTDKRIKLINDNFKKLLNNSKIHLLPELHYSISYEDITSNIEKIKQELQQIIDKYNSASEGTKDIYYSNVLNNLRLRYQILIGQGIMMSTGMFNPYLFAKQEHKVIFQHINKFHIKQPMVLMYIIHPWFSEDSISIGFDDNVTESLHSIARRIFMQYKNEEINIGKKNNSVPLCNPFRYLSGLIFILDKSLRNEEDKIYLFKNPNAIHKLPNSFVMHFSDFQVYHDDFEYDNY